MDNPYPPESTAWHVWEVRARWAEFLEAIRETRTGGRIYGAMLATLTWLEKRLPTRDG